MEDQFHPLVSIIMPAYNAGEHLEACLQSILNQTFERLELIVVDDFSTDNTLEILESYKQKFVDQSKRLKVFRNNTKGIISALRMAYENAEAQYLSRMDADDIMPLDKIESLHNKAKELPKACITGLVKYFSDGHLGNGFIRYAEWLNTLTREQSHFESIYKECIVASPCWMMNRSTLDKIGAFNPDIYPEDYDLCFRLYEHKIPIVGIPHILHLWRDHSNRASRNDPNYENQGFLDLKVSYFIKLDRIDENPLYIWGAGTAGKNLAKLLLDHDIDFHWLSNNKKKVGHNIYGKIIQDQSVLDSLKDTQIILAIKERNFQETNGQFLAELKKSNQLFNFY